MPQRTDHVVTAGDAPSALARHVCAGWREPGFPKHRGIARALPGCTFTQPTCDSEKADNKNARTSSPCVRHNAQARRRRQIDPCAHMPGPQRSSRRMQPSWRWFSMECRTATLRARRFDLCAQWALLASFAAPRRPKPPAHIPYSRSPTHPPSPSCPAPPAIENTCRYV